MYHEFYGFTKKPFSISPDPDFIYLNSYYKEALSMLRYGIEERKGVICLIGEVGTGKTMLLNKLIQTINKEVIVPSILFPINGFNELLADLIEQLNVPLDSENPTGRLQALKRHLLKEGMRDRIVVLLVDEAQTLSVKALEGLRHLSNIETPKEKLIQIVLSGQPELKDKLNLVELRQFKQRIATSFELGPLPGEEVPLYIAHRMKVAGNTQVLRLFSEQALSLVAKYSEGVPRLINALCENALLIGYGLEKRQIDTHIVTEAAKDLMLGGPDLPDRVLDSNGPPEERKELSHYVKKASGPKPEKRRRYRPILKWAAICIVFFSMLVISTVWFPRQASEVSTYINRLISEKFLELKAYLVASISDIRKYPMVGQSEAKNQIAGPLQTNIKGPSASPEEVCLRRVPSSELIKLEVVEKNPIIEFPVTEEESAPDRMSEENADTHLKVEIAPSIAPTLESDPFALPSIRDVGAEFYAMDVPGTKSPNMEQEEVSSRIRTIKPGEMISSVALEIYGFLNSYLYGMIHLANPDIKNLDLIIIGQTVFFPPLVDNSRIFKKNDDGYCLFINACQDATLAEEWKNRLTKEGVIRVQIKTTWITSNVKIHLLQIEGYRNRGEAIRHLEVLLSSPSIAEFFDAKRIQNPEVLAKY